LRPSRLAIGYVLLDEARGIGFGGEDVQSRWNRSVGLKDVSSVLDQPEGRNWRRAPQICLIGRKPARESGGHWDSSGRADRAPGDRNTSRASRA
jgi:hypothetical protein